MPTKEPMLVIVNEKPVGLCDSSGVVLIGIDDPRIHTYMRISEPDGCEARCDKCSWRGKRHDRWFLAAWDMHLHQREHFPTRYERLAEGVEIG